MKKKLDEKRKLNKQRSRPYRIRTVQRNTLPSCNIDVILNKRKFKLDGYNLDICQRQIVRNHVESKRGTIVVFALFLDREEAPYPVAHNSWGKLLISTNKDRMTWQSIELGPSELEQRNRSFYDTESKQTIRERAIAVPPDSPLLQVAIEAWLEIIDDILEDIIEDN